LHVDDNDSGIRRSESPRFRRAALHFVHSSNSLVKLRDGGNRIADPISPGLMFCVMS
jgi:hypothetical protein